MSARRKKSISDEARLFSKRGMCPNRKELLRELFKPGHKKNGREWFLSLDVVKQMADGSDLTKMKNLYVSESKKLFFLPNHDTMPPEGDLTLNGFFLLKKRNSQDCGELIGEKIALYPVTADDIMTFIPPLSDKKKKKLTQNHRVDFDDIRFKDAKIKELIAKKKQLGLCFMFHFDGFKRLKMQTTGKVWGYWV